jgi:hypothetical protein
LIRHIINIHFNHDHSWPLNVCPLSVWRADRQGFP